MTHKYLILLSSIYISGLQTMEMTKETAETEETTSLALLPAELMPPIFQASLQNQSFLQSLKTFLSLRLTNKQFNRYSMLTHLKSQGGNTSLVAAATAKKLSALLSNTVPPVTFSPECFLLLKEYSSQLISRPRLNITYANLLRMIALASDETLEQAVSTDFCQLALVDTGLGELISLMPRHVAQRRIDQTTNNNHRVHHHRHALRAGIRFLPNT